MSAKPEMQKLVEELRPMKKYNARIEKLKPGGQRMKLYRGIKSKEFTHFSPNISRQLKNTWKAILRKRKSGDFSYPEKLNDGIIAASKLVRLQRQHFTDNKKIAESYAKTNNGLLVEINVPEADILKHFTIEFQNFAQRKKAFEVVYVVDAAKLSAMSRKWKLRKVCRNRIEMRPRHDS